MPVIKGLIYIFNIPLNDSYKEILCVLGLLCISWFFIDMVRIIGITRKLNLKKINSVLIMFKNSSKNETDYKII